MPIIVILHKDNVEAVEQSVSEAEIFVRLTQIKKFVSCQILIVGKKFD